MRKLTLCTALLLLPLIATAGPPLCLTASDRVQCAMDNLSVGDSQKRVEEVLGKSVSQVSATACPTDNVTDPSCETTVVTIHVLGDDSFVVTPDEDGGLLFLDHAKLPKDVIPTDPRLGADPFE